MKETSKVTEICVSLPGWWLHVCVHMYIERQLYQNFMGKANQKTVDIDTKERKQSKYDTKDSHQITSEGNERGRKKIYKNKSKIINKMAIYIDN